MSYTLDEFKGKYNDKKMWHCDAMTNRLNLNQTTASLCHGFEVGDQIVCDIKKLTVDIYYQYLEQKFKENENKDAICRQCSKCKYQEYQYKKLEYITVCTNLNCDSHCIYCGANGGNAEDAYDPLPYIQMFEEKDCISANCLFDWGGGEPTQNPYQEKTARYLADKGYYQLFNTNAIKFSDSMYSALKKRGRLRVSVDSGTRETYYKVKGQDTFDLVWENIRKYATATDEVDIKYNIFNMNSETHDADEFLKQCKSVGNPRILLEAEFNSYCPKKNVGPFYFREKEMEFSKYLFSKAKEMGFEVSFCKGSFGSRNPIGTDGKYEFKEEYKDNIDREIITNNIFLSSCATVEQLIEKIGDKPVILWGIGSFGKKAERALKRRNFCVSCFATSDIVTEKVDIEGIPVYNIDDAIKHYPNAKIILASVYYKEMLKYINDKNYQFLNDNVYYLYSSKYYE